MSIVTPSYNSASYMEEAILSVVDQTYPRIEYIVIDGGSSDGTVDIIKRHGTRITRWVSEPDEGQADAIRKGFEMAGGELLAWLNSDDVYPPDAVQTAVEALIDSDADVVYGNRALIDGSGRRVAERKLSPFLPYFSRRGMLYGGFGVYQPASFWTRDLYLMVGGVDPSYYFALDTDLFVRFVLAGAKFRFLGREQVKFRVHPHSKTSSAKDVAKREGKRIAGRVPPRPAFYRFVVKFVCRVWKMLYHLKDSQGRYIVNLLLNRKYRFVP